MKYRIIFDSPNEMLGGVDVFTVNFVEELLRRGIRASILLTNSSRPQPYGVPFPESLPVERLPGRRGDGWPTRWKQMIRYLEGCAPCIYIPNYDFDYSCVSSRLSKDVIVAGVVHSDDPAHYEHAMRMGKYWNGIVAVSETIAKELLSFNREFAPRLTTISSGVKIPSVIKRRTNGNRLKIIYCGRLVQYQKRVLDLIPIIRRSEMLDLPFDFTIVGDGPEKIDLQNKLQDLILRGTVYFTGTLPNSQVLQLFENHDVILLVSDFEGMPVSILEAMACGCVPVVNEIRSGIPELIQNDYNGFIVKDRDFSVFVDQLRLLQQHPEIRNRLSDAARGTIQKKYDIVNMSSQYLEYFEKLKVDADSGIYKRPRGPIEYPSHIRVTWKDRLPPALHNAGWKTKVTATRIFKLLWTRK